MRLVRGSRSSGALGGRSDHRAGVALGVIFSIASACGGRTLEHDGADSGGEGNEGGVGGSGVGGGKPGSGGQGGVSSGSGGTVTAGVTGGGVSGSQPVTGGGPTTGGTGGGSPTGGVAGSVAGSAPAAGGVTMTGGRGGSGATPGRGSGGRAGSPGRGVGGSAGAPGQGGTGVGAMGGAGGQAGGGGSPAVYDACTRACSNMPATCESAAGMASECFASCPDLSTYGAGCPLELADYVECVADGLSPSAACKLTEAGECVGQGCTTTAIDACSGLLDVYSSCTVGCSAGYGAGPDGCTYTRDCLTHEYSTRCTPDGSGGWFCVCSIDGQDLVKSVLYGDASQVCVNAETYCYFAR